MQKKAVIDAGPLIALFDKDDRYHSQAISFIRAFQGQLITTSAVIAEVTHLLDFSVQAQIDLLRWIMNGGIVLSEITHNDLRRIIELTEKYSDLPMDFADASLIVLCERLALHTIVSIDKDFGIYRSGVST